MNLRFSDSYNTIPPIVQFMTIPYHPNGMLYTIIYIVYSNVAIVHPSTGTISMSLLQEGEWNESYSLVSLLLNIQVYTGH